LHDCWICHLCRRCFARRNSVIAITIKAAPTNASSQAGEGKTFPGRCPVGIVRLQGYVMSSNGTPGVSDWPSGTRVPERSGQQITISKSGRHGVMSFS
jgi:hypothetical protein